MHFNQHFFSFCLGPLCYFGDHLLWLQDDRNAVIADMNGQNTAVISGTSLSGLNMVAVLDPVLHHYPSKYVIIFTYCLCFHNILACEIQQHQHQQINEKFCWKLEIYKGM
jgi:hypothetical protein